VRPHTWEFTHGYARDSFDAAVSQWAKSVPELDLVEKALPRSISEAHDVHATIYDKTLAYYFQEEYKKEQLISRIFKQIIEHGSKVDLDQYKAALVRQQELMDDMEHFFGDVDALVTLSVAGEAPLRDETERPDSCLIWTLCGLPALNIPSLSGPNGLPMGVQLVARRYNDPLLLRLLGDLATAGVAPAGPSPKNPHVL
jgi:Asp-tRNA(Asn)/Glu-tRNA(Gln) amidotransferase A subunit family amidase